MPLFDLDCSQCGIQEDVYVSHAILSRDHPCPKCDFLADKLLSVFHPSGILPSKPLQVDHAGLSVDSNAGLREYKKKNPNARLVDRESTYWKNKVERLHSRRETQVQGEGYKDFSQYKTEKRKEIHAKKKPNP